MSLTIDNVLECVSFEIYKEKQKNVIVSCMYRSPGSNIEQFNLWMEQTFSQVKDKMIFICGDYNRFIES